MHKNDVPMVFRENFRLLISGEWVHRIQPTSKSQCVDNFSHISSNAINFLMLRLKLTQAVPEKHIIIFFGLNSKI